MAPRRIQDISVVIYPEQLEDRGITGRFLKLPGREFIPYRGEHDLGRILSAQMKRGAGSKDVVVLSDFQGRVVQSCPCSRGVVCCGYHVINTCFGCLYDCAYCFLRSYLNAFGITQFIDIDRAAESLRQIKNSSGDIVRIGTGEFTDSLMFDEITGIAATLIEAVRENPSVMLEFKTKSDNIGHLLSIRDKGSAVLAWSVNPGRIIDRYEKDTASLDERISAARRAADAGFYTAFHFDPILDYDGAPDEYASVAARLLASIEPSAVAWISLGCFRYAPAFREAAHEKASLELIANGELFPSPDGKFRYLKQKRVALYRALYQTIRSLSDTVPVYLCMEPQDVWNSVFDLSLNSPAEWHSRFLGLVKAHCGL